MNNRRSIALINLGCSKNIVDGEYIAAHLEKAGFAVTDDPAAAEIIVVNTCAFIQEAKEEAIENILQMATFKENGRCEVLVVAGCFSQRYRTEVKNQFPEVDLWVGTDDWLQKLNEYFETALSLSFERKLTGLPFSQYLKISEGCSHRCAFCAIPSIRGNFRSRPTDQLIAEAQWLESRGIQELILVSQDTTGYGKDRKSSLVALVEMILQKTSFPWIRMMYLHPQWVSDELLRLVGSEKRVCSYFDIPLQHISDSVLKAMGRRPGSAEIYKLIERIRCTVSDAGIRSSFILGFPGESDKDFRQLLRFIQWARFDKVGVFPFSPEEGTPAAEMRPRPRTSTAMARCEELMDIQRTISSDILEQHIGTTLPVIVDDISDNPDFNFEGRTQWDAPEVDGRVLIVDGNVEPGRIVPVKVIDTSDYDMFGRIE
ncbi:MAG: 30S ribosomal protein S12 methylthiotransferase RimO [Chitinivibrionales bacterium]